MVSYTTHAYLEKACWDYYTEQVTEFKTPQHCFEYSLALCNGQWRSEPHLWKTLEYTLVTAEHLRQMEIPMGQSDLAHKALMRSWNLHSQRSWTMSKHGCPPESCTDILSNLEGGAARAAARMRAEFSNILWLEELRLGDDNADTLWQDIVFLQASPIRLIYEFFHRDGASSAACRHLMERAHAHS